MLRYVDADAYSMLRHDVAYATLLALRLRHATMLPATLRYYAAAYATRLMLIRHGASARR